MSPLHVPGFGGGVVRMGGADTRGADELLAADAYDLGPRGALVCAAGTSDYVALADGVGAAVARVFGLLPTTSLDGALLLAVTQGASASGAPGYLFHQFAREGATSPVGPTVGVAVDVAAGATVGPQVAPVADGVLVTAALVPGTFPMLTNFFVGLPVQRAVFFVNLGAREGTAPVRAPGLYAIVVDVVGGVTTYTPYPVGKFDALGTGPFGALALAGVGYGTRARQLHFRGIAAYNGYVFGWGYDAADATNGDGPCRVMFCNVGNPLAWGVDNTPDAFEADGRTPKDPPVDRAFTDSDAIVLGGAGEHVRAALPIYGKLFFGTNRGLHFLQGYGRNTFVTNGAQPVTQAHNVLGPNALVEGPDRQLYGVGDQGLWRFDGAGVPEPLFERLYDYDGRSPGWFDCIWTQPELAAGYPGKTNADLVWLAVDWDRHQVLLGIPYCDASSGEGPGSDTLVIKYHPRTGGFTRQVFPGVAYTSPGYFRGDGAARPTQFLAGGAVGVGRSVQRYGDGLPAALPSATFGPYAPFGPEGEGVVPRWAPTIAWSDPSALPLAFRVGTTVDDAALPDYTLTIGPSAPVASDGDCWLDTSESDPSVGNARGSANVRANGGALLKTWSAAAAAWRPIPGQGARGTRATLPLPVERRVGARVTFSLTTLTARGRFQLEGLGVEPGAGAPTG